LLDSELLYNPNLCFSKIMFECFPHNKELEKDSKGENSDDWPNSL
jgi:hypothetical protein